MRRLGAAVVVSAFGLAAVAHAQSTTNQYTVEGGTSIRGGTVKKPKPAGLNFTFTHSDATGLLPAVVKTYEVVVEGGKVNSNIIPGCSGSAMDRAGSDSVCPAKSKIGTGQLTALIGAPGKPAADASATCKLPIQIYNSGHGKAALWIKTGPPACVAPVAQSVPATWTKSGTSAGLKFTVPDTLRHQVGLDLPVISASATIKKITVTKNGKTTGYLESTGCKDGKRDFSAIFTSEAGVSDTVKKTLSYC